MQYVTGNMLAAIGSKVIRNKSQKELIDDVNYRGVGWIVAKRVVITAAYSNLDSRKVSFLHSPCRIQLSVRRTVPIKNYKV
jgi:hypothetical protein